MGTRISAIPGAAAMGQAGGQALQGTAMGRRGALLLGLGAAWVGPAPARAAGPLVEVWKDANCGCCEGWVRHLRAAGFTVRSQDVAEMPAIKRAHGVPEALWSCHTGLVGGYVVEGHVPADDLRRLLAEKPAARGLSAPGMPASAPGMDMPGEPYQVILFGAPEGDRIFARH